MLNVVSLQHKQPIKTYYKMTTKKEITEKTTSRGIYSSNQKTYTYQVSMNENYTKDIDENVLYNIGNSSTRLGYATTKNQFIDLVYNHINRIH